MALRERGHRVLPTERSRGPAERARARLGEVRVGEGLEPLAPGEVQVVVAAGMGGLTIARLLEHSPEVTARLDRLVLQPMQREAALRSWLGEHGFAIEREEGVVDRGRRYTVLLVRPPA